MITTPDRRAADVEAVARILIDAWERAEDRPVNVSYIATHADMARAVLDSTWLADLLATAKREALTEAAEAFATGEWLDAFMAEPVEDDVSAVRATERWLRARAEATP